MAGAAYKLRPAAMNIKASLSSDSVVRAYFERRGWKPFAFQRDVWAAMRAGRSGLLHATTGAGKTLAVGFGAWLLCSKRPAEASLRILWITPMRALAADTARSLEAAFAEVGG